MSGDERQARIAQQLAAVREHSYARIDSWPKIDTSLLEQAAGEISGYRDRMSRANKIELLLMHEVPLAPLPYRRQLIVLFGLLDLLDESDPLREEKLDPTHPPSLRRKAMGIAGETEMNTYRRRQEPDALRALAAQITADCLATSSDEHVGISGLQSSAGPATAAEVASVHLSPQSPLNIVEPLGIPYVHRAQLERQIRESVESGARLIALVGEPGNGKSRLADELVRRRMRPGDTRIDLLGRSTGKLFTDIAGVLQSRVGHKIGTYLTTDDALTRAFAAFICSSDAPTYVVIDDIEDPELVDRLVPSSAHPIVVITSRENVLPDGRGTSIIVDPMEDDEARLLATSLLPPTSKEDIDQLIQMLGNKPLAIDHACNGLLADGYMTIQQFGESFRRHAAGVMRHAKNPTEHSLPFIYEQILRRLRGRDKQDGTKAASLLELITFMAPESIPADVLSDSLAVISPPEYVSMKPVQFQSAQRELRRLNLIRPQDGDLSIHHFTQDIIRDMLRDVAVEKCLVLHRRLAAKFSHAQPEDYQDERTLRLLPHIFDVATTLAAADSVAAKAKGVDRTLEMLMSGIRRFGDAALTMRIILRYLRNRPYQDLQEIGEAYFILLERIYLGGNRRIMSRSEYADLLRMQNREKYGDPSSIQLYSRAGVFLIEAAMLDYKYDFVDEVLDAHSKETRLGSPKDAIWRGDVLRLSGDALAAQAKWQESSRAYRLALDAYTRGKADSICHIRWVITHASMANAALDAGDFFSAAKIAGSLESAEEMSRHATSIEVCQVLRCQIREMVVCSVRNACRGAPGDVSMHSSLESFYTAVLSLHNELGRYIPTLKYDIGCHLLLRGKLAEARRMFEQQASIARDLGELDTALMYHLGLIKIRIMEDRASLRDIDRCLRIGRKFRDICHMPNRYADALGTAYVIAVRGNAPAHVVDSLQEIVESIYADLGKTWKYELLKEAVGDDFREMTLFLP